MMRLFPKTLAAAVVAKTAQYTFSSASPGPHLRTAQNQSNESSISTQQHSTISADGELIFRCKCGDIKATLQGLPVQNANCHCRSCVASAKTIQSKPNFNGVSILNVGGVSYADFRWRNINFVTPFDTDMTTNEARDSIGFVKVGERGKMARSYCTRCGTMIGVFSPNNVFFNRNAIYNRDGSPYKSAEPVNNIMCRFAFDPSKVPEPNYSFVPMGMVMSFIPIVLGFGEKKSVKDSALFPADLSTVEVVPITWE